MRALVLGGTGQTGAHVVTGLRARGVDVLAATRDPKTTDQRRFDWHDDATHDAALRDVDALYLIAPALVLDPAPLMIALLDRALARGVGNFVLLGSSAIDPDEPGIGAVHATLRDRAPAWTVLRPSWFMQNFSDPRHTLARSIAAGAPIRTSTGRGRIGFIDVADIAAVAVHSILSPSNTDLILTGPEALSYDDAAKILSEVTGRTIVHQAVTPAEAHAEMLTSGMPASYADLLVALEQRIAAGAEARVTDVVRALTGRPPRSLRAFAEATMR